MQEINSKTIKKRGNNSNFVFALGQKKLVPSPCIAYKGQTLFLRGKEKHALFHEK